MYFPLKIIETIDSKDDHTSQKYDGVNTINTWGGPGTNKNNNKKLAA